MNSDVQAAFFTALSEFATDNSIDVAWPSLDFTPGDSAYIAPYYLPAETSNLGLAITNQTGIFQVSVMTPDGAGVVAAMDTADDIIAEFPRGFKLFTDSMTILIERQGWVGPTITRNGWVNIPVSLQFRLIY